MSKLYTITRAGFALPYESDPRSRSVKAVPAHNLPCMRWPNGRWCFPANQYMLSLFERGLSRLGIGGTLATYASNIGHLVRFCFVRRQEFHDLTDGQFTTFIDELRAPVRPNGAPVRTDNHVLAIAENCLDFLSFVADDRDDGTLLGKKGRIRAYRKQKIGADGGYVATRWSHPSLPTPDAKKRRQAILSKDMERLRDAVLPESRTLPQRRRRYVMLRCLELTGGRRMEIVALRVADVIAAIKSPDHRLKLLNVKRPGGKVESRIVPSTLNDLTEIWRYIEQVRAPIIRRTIGPERDHGFVFVNERSGQPLRPNTVTQEIHHLARAAGMESRVSPHMFRHRFITKIFVALILKYKSRTPSELRRALLGIDEAKRELMEWTGHKSMESLDHYIDLAFAEAEGLQASMDPVKALNELDALRRQIDLYAGEMAGRGNLEVADYLRQLLGRSPSSESA